LSGIEQMIMLWGGFERITLQLGDIENNTIIFLILNIKISFVINSYKIHLYHVGCMIFGMRNKKNLKNMLEKTFYQAGMTWQFGRISGRHTSWRIYGRNTFSTWCPIVSHDAHNPVKGTKDGKFRVRLPQTPEAPFHFFFVSYYFLKLNLMISFFISKRHITISWRWDKGTILRPTRISFQIYGWRQDRLVDPIEIGCTDSPILWPRTCKRPIVSQPLGSCNR
jgi:hypothetical protein